jgi:hypothetical protein
MRGSVMKRRLLLLAACAVRLTNASGCLTLSALFNTKRLFRYETRRTVAAGAGAADLVLTMPGIGIAGYNYLSRERDWEQRRSDFMTFYWMAGWELFILADYACAWALYKLLWGETLFHRKPLGRRRSSHSDLDDP